ncbi:MULTISPECIES: DUF1934 domain-containing protein [Streptococcus]|uniref:DUF1934 domain-containing protein n=1 Tax=Streptococcus ruminantium TaxID=1917441 RepID=A0ABU1B1Q8_9STRE|nr:MULTISPECIES: DUF1934 domain-containing protein [Streptococcus]MDQ8759198.1 DUF1934 domain-containing protein [Streptococcus ruminantium]MDQ8764249.1 DUF1934 domain-containing protein [Streptococcus ruminantium]MDQ8768652.1 DUF1934 domain-containing protein [Streptococcus ruminantium]MDQ8774421.1 DUF1934 domain-containing protein [Streptococcus ruminantium]MDQ8793801.1 DUF1934 domain-containing protein [Streptococcus ruminantium]
MEIRLRNEIDLDGQVEVVDQQFQVEVREKGEQLYLMYTNDESEKVVIKCDKEELVMTRFSEPKSIMRFMLDREAIVTIPTPMGIQHFVTDTKQYRLHREKQYLRLRYELKGLENQQRFASYRMEISWK